MGTVLRRQHDIGGIATAEQVETIVAERGIEVYEPYPFTGRLRAAILDDTIYLRGGLDTGWRTALLAHELGHHALHAGNALFLALPQRRMLRDRREREAQMFAGTLILGVPFQDDLDAVLLEAYEAGIPPDFLLSYLAVVHARPNFLPREEPSAAPSITEAGLVRR